MLYRFYIGEGGHNLLLVLEEGHRGRYSSRGVMRGGGSCLGGGSRKRGVSWEGEGGHIGGGGGEGGGEEEERRRGG